MRKPFTLTLVAVMAAAALLTTGSAAAGEAVAPRLRTGPDAIKNSYIVVYEDDRAVSALGVDVMTQRLATRYRAAVIHTYRHALHGFAATLTEAAARDLAGEPGVAYVEQNRVVRTMSTQAPAPSWGLDRIDQRQLPLDNSYTYANTASSVTAYIIDTGIGITHHDFAGRAMWGTNTTGDGVNSDCFGHGTAVAATVGGTVYGVAKEVRLVAVKVLNCAGSGTLASVIAGVDWITTHHHSGPAVAAMALGVAGESPSVENAVRRSIADGVVYAVAAGNANANACGFSPARVPEAITVGASDIRDARASFSNFGTCTDIYAPGVNIVSSWNSGSSTVTSGTSMAAAHIAGAAALILHANPQMLAWQLPIALLANASRFPVGPLVYDPPAGDFLGPELRCSFGWGASLQFNTAIVDTTPSIVAGGPSQLRANGWVRVLAAGTIAIRVNNEGVYNPNGADEIPWDFAWPGPTLKKWSLVGEFGANMFNMATIQIGTDSGCMQVPADTYLRLWINDDITNDNQGQWAVSVDYFAPA